MIKYVRLLLLPFSVIYGIVVVLRNKLYDWGIFKSHRFDIPVICVGNLVVGGSGKSPVTEYLVHLLGDYKIAILSRGYGRDTKGFLYADKTSTAKSIGDEPLQFYHKFPQLTVAVCEDRVKGVSMLRERHDVIILDDAFQHRRLNPGFSILLFEFQKLLEWQFLLPAGNMREPFRGYKRADILLVTKSPLEIGSQQKNQCAGHFKHAADQLFFSSIAYKELHDLYTTKVLPVNILKHKKVFLLTGIANPGPLFDYLSQFAPAIEHHDYPDHHSFSSGNLSKLVKAFRQDPAKEKIIITTEKDAQRLFDVTIRELLLDLPVFYLPIQINIDADYKKTFDQKILKYVSDTTRDR
ncbi:tetraacyldisaccharide 4'-kinase [Pedobacter lusitanus]|uniref:Tetraacyldisaccharide 4'-kinase n=1 Tax=Pedobacter lusitanus TaxID=1503925 RepID=A0A0D0GVJ5_9SPHI|nr:tetraacyldisaccharide 4'-kinase [Pedobacter lusitanus]KIO78436.1 tetraacyldisaccharide 4'-kinase [Pedobacter lusitanus]